MVHKIGAVLPDYSHGDIVQLTTGTSSALFRDLSPELKQAVIAQVTDSISRVFVYVLAVSSLGFILSLSLSVRDSHFLRKTFPHPPHPVSQREFLTWILSLF